MLNGTNTSFGKPASLSEAEQSKGSCVIWNASLVKKIGSYPVGRTSHLKQKVRLYPKGFVSDAVIP